MNIEQNSLYHYVTIEEILEKDSWLLSRQVPTLNGSGPMPKIQFGIRFWLLFDALCMRLAYPTTHPILTWINSSPCGPG